MARPLWSGSLSFGLVNVPVELYSAMRDRQLHYTQLHDTNGSPVEIRRRCTKEDVDVEWDEVGHAYELDDGREVVLTDEELDAVAPRRTRTIEVDQFAALDELDPALLDHSYVLLPAGESDGTLRAYRLLLEAMSEQEVVAIGRFVLRSAEYLAAIRPDGPLLALSTMRFHDELRDRSQADAPSGRAHHPKPRELREAAALIDSLTTDFDPARWRERHRARLRKLIRRKAQGETIRPPRHDPEHAATPDLMEALELSIASVGAGRG